MRKPETIKMDLPIRFPSDADVIIEEVARFRELSDEQCIQLIRGLLEAGMMMIRQSPKSVFLREYTLEQDNRARQAVKEFVARHGS
jgi:hypothetical protein